MYIRVRESPPVRFARPRLEAKDENPARDGYNASIPDKSTGDRNGRSINLASLVGCRENSQGLLGSGWLPGVRA